MFDDIDEQDMLPILEVRVLDATKKTSFRVRRLTNFPVAETMDEMKSTLQIFMPDITHDENWQIMYILERNKKYTIETSGELQDAYQEFRKGYQMWLDPSPVKPAMWLDPSPVKPAASKRQSGTSAKGNVLLSL